MPARLGLCSAYSLLYGVRKPGEMAAAVRETGAEIIAICDRDNLYGVHTALETAKEGGMRPVIGAMLTNNKDKGKYTVLSETGRDSGGYVKF